MPSLRKKPAPAPVVQAPPIGSASINVAAIFAVAAITFGATLLSLWRFGPANGETTSFMLVGGLLSLFCGGYAGIQELGLISNGDETDGAFGDGSD